jgi:hypothetical protein
MIREENEDMMEIQEDNASPSRQLHSMRGLKPRGYRELIHHHLHKLVLSILLKILSQVLLLLLNLKVS